MTLRIFGQDARQNPAFLLGFPPGENPCCVVENAFFSRPFVLAWSVSFPDFGGNPRFNA
jgi:hypothetical protein